MRLAKLMGITVVLALAVPAVRSQGVASLTAPDYRQSLVRFEGVRTRPYREKNGDWSVGIGHNLSAHKETVKQSYSKDEISAFFDRDLSSSIRAARRLVEGFDELPDPAKEVVIHLIFQCGPTGFSKFKALRYALSKRAYSVAVVELWDSKWFRDAPDDRANWALRKLRSL